MEDERTEDRDSGLDNGNLGRRDRHLGAVKEGI
jgi:hypothetical protein